MARPKTATSILKARGSFAKNPDRARPLEPQVKEPINRTPPGHFSEMERDIWREIIDLAPHGVLTSADYMSVELVAVLMCEFRLKKAETPGVLINRLAAELSRLGLNPSGRAGLTVDKPKEQNQFKTK